jgi:hypothetical protein
VFCANLDENDVFCLATYYVYFAFTTAEIFLDNGVAAPYEEIGRQLFAKYACLPAVHGIPPIASRTG